jgi:hypothetical protein
MHRLRLRLQQKHRHLLPRKSKQKARTQKSPLI